MIGNATQARKKIGDARTHRIAHDKAHFFR
jgi:hypothetical protein